MATIMKNKERDYDTERVKVMQLLRHCYQFDN